MKSLILLAFIILVHSADLNLLDILNISNPLHPVGAYQKGQYSLKRYSSFVRFNSIYECLDVMVGENTEWLKYVYRMILSHVDVSSNLKDESQELTRSEIIALFYYTTNAYTAINTQLRSGEAGVYNCYLNYLFSAFEKLKVDDSVTQLYSGMQNNGARLNQLIDSSNMPLVAANDILTSNSLSSSTTNFNVAINFAYNPDDAANPGVIITVKNPKSPVPIYLLSMYTNEAEILFPPQATFKVLSVTDYFCEVDTDGTLTCPAPDNAASKVKFIRVEVEETEKKPYFETVAGSDPHTALVDCSEDTATGSITCPHPGRCFDNAGVQFRCPVYTLGTHTNAHFHGCYNKEDVEITNCVVKVEVKVKEAEKDGVIGKLMKLEYFILFIVFLVLFVAALIWAIIATYVSCQPP